MISAIIPTLNAAAELPRLIETLRGQTVPPEEIFVIDSSSDDGTEAVAVSHKCTVERIARAEFDHGATRNQAALRAAGDTLLFLTQDAMPACPHFVELMTRPIDGTNVAATYARQLPREDSSEIEKFTRQFNYPAESQTRWLRSTDRRTLRTFFFSNAAAAVDRRCFEKVGGFPDPVKSNEDMLLCAKLLDAGYAIRYVAEARVIHSHDLDYVALSRRYFRMGVTSAQYGQLLRCEGESGDGFLFVQQQLKHLFRTSKYRHVPDCLLQAAIKAVSYHAGKHSATKEQPQVERRS